MAILIVQRVISTFSKTKRHTNDKGDQLFAAGMILLYGTVCIVGSYNFIVFQDIHVSLIIFGLVFLMGGIWLRTHARRVLGDNWSLYAKVVPRRLMKLGPYQFCRHPYYLGSLIEIISISIILHSTISVLIVLCVYLPLIFIRMLIEENKLKQKFE